MLLSMNKLCTVEGCDREARARGWCMMHYDRWRKNGDPLKVQHVSRWDGKTCTSCGGEGPFYKNSRKCQDCDKKQQAQWRAGNREREREIGRLSARRNHQRRRDAAIAAYGGVCTCCGEHHQIFLAIDHIDGGGNAHRRSLGTSGKMVGSSNFYRWLEKEGFPKGFQVLCHNCNFAKSHGGCPHELHSC